MHVPVHFVEDPFLSVGDEGKSACFGLLSQLGFHFHVRVRQCCPCERVQLALEEHYGKEMRLVEVNHIVDSSVIRAIVILLYFVVPLKPVFLPF